MAGPAINRGSLARRIHTDKDFPNGANKQELKLRLKQLAAPENEIMIFMSSWKLYTTDQNKNVREANLEKRLVREVESRGGICWKFVSPGMNGVPDRIILVPSGRTYFVEMKAPGKKMRPLQRKRATELQDVGFQVYCLDSNQGIHDFIQEVFGDEI